MLNFLFQIRREKKNNNQQTNAIECFHRNPSIQIIECENTRFTMYCAEGRLSSDEI